MSTVSSRRTADTARKQGSGLTLDPDADGPGLRAWLNGLNAQHLLAGQQAEAYADHFIAVHIADMAGGKTYSQLSAESIAQPGNTQLAGLVNTVFKGETLRSMLLNAYGWWKVSQITYIISLAAFGLG